MFRKRVGGIREVKIRVLEEPIVQIGVLEVVLTPVERIRVFGSVMHGKAGITYQFVLRGPEIHDVQDRVRRFIG